MMAQYKYGNPQMVKGTPSTPGYNSGDVVIVGDTTMIAHADNPQSPSLSIITDALAAEGGVYIVQCDAAYPVGTFVYWNPTTQQITTAAAGNYPFGRIVSGATGQWSDGTTTANGYCDVLHQPIDSPTLLLFAGASAADTVTNTAVETAFATVATIPAGTLQAGDVIHVRAVVEVTAQNSTNTNDVKLKITTALATFTAIVNTGAINAAAGALAVIDVDLVVTAIGASGSFYAVGMSAFGAQGTATMSPVALAATAFNTTIALTIEVTDTQSAASAGNIAQLLLLDAQIKRK